MNKVFSFLTLLFLIGMMTSCAQSKKNDYVVTIKTKYGDMVAILYDETPKHKENFIKLAKDKFYDSLIFHRVIEGFMIQGGDPDSRNAQPGAALGRGGPGYTVDAEINPKFFHEKGALSAARLGDQMNPKKASSGSQFYIVQGNTMSEQEVTQLEENIRYQRKNNALRELLQDPKYADLRTSIIQKQQAGDAQWLNDFFLNADTLIQKEKPDYKLFSFSPEQKAAYTKVGGAPHLDGDYTVFGKVIKGLEIIDKIAAQPKGPGDRPMDDIHMVVTVEEMSKKKIEKEYGYIYPEN